MKKKDLELVRASESRTVFSERWPLRLFTDKKDEIKLIDQIHTHRPDRQNGERKIKNNAIMIMLVHVSGSSAGSGQWLPLLGPWVSVG